MQFTGGIRAIWLYQAPISGICIIQSVECKRPHAHAPEQKFANGAVTGAYVIDYSIISIRFTASILLSYKVCPFEQFKYLFFGNVFKLAFVVDVYKVNLVILGYNISDNSCTSRLTFAF
jgi:hypothetical protein